MTYTEDQILSEFKKNIDKAEKLYTQNFINWRGTIDGNRNGKPYSEIIASELLKDLSLLNNIQQISRSKSYNTISHYSGTIENRETNRKEEIFAKKVYSDKKINLGNEILDVLDFQVPLKDKQGDKAGKIDLIAFNKNTSILYLVELKFGTNKETLLRAILEAHTYYKIIDKAKLVSDFNFKDPLKIKAAVMVVCIECNSYQELEDIENRPNLLKLAKELDITFFKSADQQNFYVQSI